ncbi:DUF1826 domain-containing protein [Granulosicoccus antarcticus]|uniref:DUF1826 domain-containing protein n=1 Tax=Granulosicoccus antarcticus IMCC3135 TaxID=1192854 RepID=A0A2Z2NWN4_9GAMM|nr:DUF1826 domain-containing protein [Granulosicoccus antarcticus]ASJ73250.1 hypothetical protein IMCC3135_15840 [Granulosicoccus antarcticus IMCC3135]
MHALKSVVDHELKSWHRVSEIAELARIFEPSVQVCSWQRTIDPQISTYLDGIAGLEKLRAMETLSQSSRVKLSDFPLGAGREALINDITLLSEILCELVNCPSVGFRCTRIEHTMCPRWHIDRVPLRLLCTYEGPGTEWLEDQGVDRHELSSSETMQSPCQRASIGELVLLKGALWQDNDGLGAIHRSPAIASSLNISPRVGGAPVKL